MDAVHLHPADQNDAAAEMLIPDENNQHATEDASPEDANDESSDEEKKPQH